MLEHDDIYSQIKGYHELPLYNTQFITLGIKHRNLLDISPFGSEIKHPLTHKILNMIMNVTRKKLSFITHA